MTAQEELDPHEQRELARTLFTVDLSGELYSFLLYKYGKFTNAELLGCPCT